MYKPIDKLQSLFQDFDQPMGLHMNPDNRWIKMADRIPWDEFEINYAELFPSDIGNIAKLLRMALGILIIQIKFQYADRELVERITENPYLQYFIGIPGYQEEVLFDASTLFFFRKRISAEILMEAKDDTNKGPLTLDAFCAPTNIRYLHDVSLLNEAREKLKTIIYRFCKSYDLPLSRRYRRRAREKYITFAKSKVQRRSVRYFADSWVTSQETSGI